MPEAVLPTLPFWIRHGEVFWIAAAVLATLAGVLIARRRGDPKAAAQAEAARKALGDASERVEHGQEGEVVLRGELHASRDGSELSQLTLAVDNAQAKQLDCQLWLDVSGARVELGAVQVMAGSIEEHRKEAVYRALYVGDQVHARGLLSSAGDYRAADSFRLVPERDGGAVSLIYADDPWRDASRRALCWGAGLGAAAFFALSYAAGALLLDLGQGLLLHSAAQSPWSARVAQLVALTPFQRGDGLELLRQNWMPDEDASLEEAARFAALETWLGYGCERSVRALVRSGRLAQAADLGGRCSDRASLRLASRAALVDGRPELANQLLGRAPAEEPGEEDDLSELWFDLLVQLLAGGGKQSAATFQRLVQAKPGDYHITDQRRLALRCLALHAQLGPDDDPKELQSAARLHPVCRVLFYDRLEPWVRKVIMSVRDPMPRALGDVEDRLLLDVADDEIALAPLPPPALPADVAIGRVMLELPGRGLSQSALKASAKSRERKVTVLRAELALRLALEDAAMGDAKSATRGLDRAEREFAGIGAASERANLAAQIPAYRAAMYLLAGDTARARSALEGRAPEDDAELLSLVRYAETGDPAELSRLPHDPYGAEGLPATNRRSGAALATWLERAPSYVTLAGLSLGARQIRSDKQPLLRLLKADQDRQLCVELPGCQLTALPADLAARGRAAAALGDAALSSELQARALRLKRALSRREIAVPLAALSSL